jgi:Putative bacterial sensory transduction regulator
LVDDVAGSARLGRVIADAIPGYFDQVGWQYDRRRHNEFRTGFVGEKGSWDVSVKVSKLLVTFSVPQYVERPDDTPPGPTLLLALLRANHELNLAKLSIGTDGDICLSVELPVDDFSMSQFKDAIMALVHYTDEFKERLDDAVTSDTDDGTSSERVL